jgi:hypothetical protein
LRLLRLFAEEMAKLIPRVWHVDPLRCPSFIVHPFRHAPTPDYENVLTD